MRQTHSDGHAVGLSAAGCREYQERFADLLQLLSWAEELSGEHLETNWPDEMEGGVQLEASDLKKALDIAPQARSSTLAPSKNVIEALRPNSECS